MYSVAGTVLCAWLVTHLILKTNLRGTVIFDDETRKLR